MKQLLIAILVFVINTGCIHLDEYAGGNPYGDSMANQGTDWNQDDDPMWNGDVDPMDWWCLSYEIKERTLKTAINT